MKMTRQPHDQYSKEALLEILAFFGGKSEAQRFLHQAVETLVALSDQGPLFRNVFDVFHKWHEDTKTQENLTPEDKELLMVLSPAYEKSRTQALLEGMLQGREQGKQQGCLDERQFYVENLLKLRFGIDEALSQLNVSPTHNRQLST
jgi:hypothetical protein